MDLLDEEEGEKSKAGKEVVRKQPASQSPKLPAPVAPKPPASASKSPVSSAGTSTAPGTSEPKPKGNTNSDNMFDMAFTDFLVVTDKHQGEKEETAHLYSKSKGQLKQVALASGIPLVKLHNNIVDAFLKENKEEIMAAIAEWQVKQWED